MAEDQGFKSLSFYNKITKENISLVSIWKEWTTNKKLNKLKKTKMRNIN